MICFEVSVNGEKLCTAGIGEYGVLSCILSWVKRHPDRYKPEMPIEFLDEELHLDVGGIEDKESIKWLKDFNLEVGSEISIRIIESDYTDEPLNRQPLKNI